MSKDNILNDLLRRRPEGPKGKNITYITVRGDWCYRRHDYKKVTKPSDHQFGYTDDELFKLGFMNRHDVDQYFRLRDFEGKSDYRLGRRKSTLTRRVNLIWDRIESAIYRVSREGRKGIYAIRHYYSTVQLGHVYARNMAEAKESAKLFFGYLIPTADQFKVTFVKIGEVSEISALNVQINNDIKLEIQSLKDSIIATKGRISNLEAILTTLSTVESQQIAVETVYALNNID
jgi:hypothetical protein